MGDTAHSRQMLLQIWIDRYDPWAINSICYLCIITKISFLKFLWKVNNIYELWCASTFTVCRTSLLHSSSSNKQVSMTIGWIIESNFFQFTLGGVSGYFLSLSSISFYCQCTCSEALEASATRAIFVFHQNVKRQFSLLKFTIQWKEFSII